MNLLGQTLAVGGAAIAAAGASRLLRGRWDWGRSAVLVAVVVCAAMVAGNGLDTARTLARSWREGRHRSALQAQLLPGELLKRNVRFIDWLRTQIPPKQTYFVAPHRTSRSNLTRAWLSFRILPRVEVGSPRTAQWLVLYQGRSDLPPAEGSAFGPVRWFAPGYGIARRRAG